MSLEKVCNPTGYLSAAIISNFYAKITLFHLISKSSVAEPKTLWMTNRNDQLTWTGMAVAASMRFPMALSSSFSTFISFSSGVERSRL